MIRFGTEVVGFRESRKGLRVNSLGTLSYILYKIKENSTRYTVGGYVSNTQISKYPYDKNYNIGELYTPDELNICEFDLFDYIIEERFREIAENVNFDFTQVCMTRNKVELSATVKISKEEIKNSVLLLLDKLKTSKITMLLEDGKVISINHDENLILPEMQTIVEELGIKPTSLNGTKQRLILKEEIIRISYRFPPEVFAHYGDSSLKVNVVYPIEPLAGAVVKRIIKGNLTNMYADVNEGLLVNKKFCVSNKLENKRIVDTILYKDSLVEEYKMADKVERKNIEMLCKLEENINLFVPLRTIQGILNRYPTVDRVKYRLNRNTLLLYSGERTGSIAKDVFQNVHSLAISEDTDYIIIGLKDGEVSEIVASTLEVEYTDFNKEAVQEVLVNNGVNLYTFGGLSAVIMSSVDGLYSLVVYKSIKL